MREGEREGRGGAYEVPEPGTPELAVGEGVVGGGLEVRAVDHVELDCVSGLGFAVDLRNG